VTIGTINDFTAVANGLRARIPVSGESDAAPLRKQLADVELALRQVQARLDAMHAELDGIEQANVPAGVFRGGTGLYYKHVEGVTVPVCEDCWAPIPHYRERDFRHGLISPESDGDAGGNFVKRRRQMIEGKIGEWRPGKVVCVPCYVLAFQRVYPGAVPPQFDDALVSSPRSSVPTVLAPFEYVPEPKAGVPADVVMVTPEQQPVGS